MARFVFYWLLVPPLFFLGFSSSASEYPDKVFWGDTHIHTALSGDASLIGIWSDPEHNPSKAAVYYARVLQIPTPRWTLYDKVRFGIKDMDEAIPLVIQERAYSSPIWYKPEKN